MGCACEPTETGVQTQARPAVTNKHSENEESRKGFDLLQWFELCRKWPSLTPEAGVYIPQLISLIREKDVADPKDKIYGVLGLPS